MRYTILRPVFFMENWFGMRTAIEGGALTLPLDPATRLQMVAVDDIGGMVAAAFEHPGKWQERAFEIGADELSMIGLVQALSRAVGRDVEYRQAPWGDFEAQSGPEAVTMYRWFQDVGYSADIPAVRQEYPRLTSFDRWLNVNWRATTRTA